MRRRVGLLLAVPFFAVAATIVGAQAPPPTASSSPAWLDAYRDPASRLIGEAMSSTFAWDRLAVLTDTIGNRLSGTPALDRAIQWAAAEMKKDGLENVHTERVMVPKWVRGSESAEIVEPARHSMVMLGLGDSVGTGGDAIQAEVMVVHTFDELDATGIAGARAHRPLQRAVHQLRRDGAIPIRRAVAGLAPRRGRDADSRGRPGRPAHAAHRRAAVRGRREEDSGGGHLG